MTSQSSSGGIDGFYSSLARVSGARLDYSKGLFEQDALDSVDVIEWLYSIEEQYDVEIDEDLVDNLATASMRELFHNWTEFVARHS